MELAGHSLLIQFEIIPFQSGESERYRFSQPVAGPGEKASN